MSGNKGRIDAFKKRVRLAEQCYLNGVHDRKLDNCFEMHDGEMVVVALMRRAHQNPALMAAIRADFASTSDQDWSWARHMVKHRALSDTEIAETAVTMQLEAEWVHVNIFIPQLRAAQTPGYTPDVVTREEEGTSHSQNIWAGSIEDAVQIVHGWEGRTLNGAPYFSLFSTVQVVGPNGEVREL